jgi:hypothetical protein
MHTDFVTVTSVILTPFGGCSLAAAPLTIKA